jgi:hypothetical protein
MDAVFSHPDAPRSRVAASSAPFHASSTGAPAGMETERTGETRGDAVADAASTPEGESAALCRMAPTHAWHFTARNDRFSAHGTMGPAVSDTLAAARELVPTSDREEATRDDALHARSGLRGAVGALMTPLLRLVDAETDGHERVMELQDDVEAISMQKPRCRTRTQPIRRR